ncbi:hypothetical protein PV327_009495 [Microctonus hyperodae]|uniref:Uncharacterized protein n=1 Tax=Microctonus hyperodae TaxID=165561 RepID=A0AA39FUH7_MICHY|nr:hypothetical protein PV327_009495 [Microctonus hyperodae]
MAIVIYITWAYRQEDRIFTSFVDHQRFLGLERLCVPALKDCVKEAQLYLNSHWNFMMRERLKEKGENSFDACVSIIVYHNREVKAVVQRSRGHAPVTDITL